MYVHVPHPLRGYTHQQNRVETEGASLGEALSELDRRFPGIRFRIVDEQEKIREHIKVFVNQAQVFRLDQPLEPADQVRIICAISGGAR